MSETYTSNNGIEKPTPGTQEGEWGTTLNTNFDIIDRVLSGVGSITLSGTTHTLTTTDGQLTDGMFKVLLLGGSPSGTNTITITPNDQDKLYFVVNSSGQSVNFTQGSGTQATVENGAFNAIYADGAGDTAAVKSLFANDIVFGDDVSLQSDGAILRFGADNDTTLTHTDGTGLTLNSTNKITFGDVASFIQQSSDGVLRIDGEATIDLNASTAVTVSNDLKLDSDAAVLGFGVDNDVTLTHVADTGLLLNSTSQLQFNDASQNITAPSATVLDINATDEVEINATLADVNANLDVSGTYTGGGLMTTGGNIVIPDSGNIGSASDTDALSISSGGVVAFSQVPTFPNNTIETADIQDDAVTQAKIADSAVGSDQIASDAVTQAKIADDAVGADQLASNAVVTASITNANVTTAKIADDAVTQAKIADDAVGADQLASDAVVTASITDGNVTTAKINDNAVTLAKLAGIARGKLIVGDSSGDPSVIGPGTNGQVLLSDGTDISFGTFTATVALDDISTGDAASTLATSAGNITVDAQGNNTDIIFKGTDGGADTTFLTLDGSDGGTASFNHDVKLGSDASILGFGADNDVTLTHVADTGLLLNGTSQIQFNDASQNITAPSGTVLDINATDEVEINATLADVNANLDVSGTYTGGGLMTTGGNIVIPDAGNIGSASDTDAIAIASGGAVTFSQLPVLPKGTLTNAVLQVVTASNSGTVNTTSTSYADITSVTANITPQNSANKILVLYNSDALYSLTAGANVTYSHKVLRDSTSLGERAITAASGGGGLQSRAPMSLVVLDSPSSASELTYKAQHKISNASSTGSTVTTHITLVEIAG